MSRNTLKIHDETKDRLDELKREGETIDGLLNRAFDALEEDRTAEAMERQAEATEAIAGALLLRESDDRQLNPEALLREARFHYDPDDPQI